MFSTGVPRSQLQMGVKHGRCVSKYKTYTKKFKKVKIFLVPNHEQKILKNKKIFITFVL